MSYLINDGTTRQLQLWCAMLVMDFKASLSETPNCFKTCYSRKMNPLHRHDAKYRLPNTAVDGPNVVVTMRDGAAVKLMEKQCET